MKAACLAFALLALGACSQSDMSAGPGGVTKGEARALDEAATMLDARAAPTEALESQTVDVVDKAVIAP